MKKGSFHGGHENGIIDGANGNKSAHREEGSKIPEMPYYCKPNKK